VITIEAAQRSRRWCRFPVAMPKVRLRPIGAGSPRILLDPLGRDATRLTLDEQSRSARYSGCTTRSTMYFMPQREVLGRLAELAVCRPARHRCSCIRAAPGGCDTANTEGCR
jgi:hypothetical protein